MSASCPAVMRRADGTKLIIVGDIVTEADYPELTGKIGQDEMAVEIAAPLVEEALAGEHAAKLREYMDICESLSAQKAELGSMLTNALSHIDAIHRAFGAPGDWGYGDVKGIALFDAIKFAAATQAKLDSREHNEMPERDNG